MATPTDILVTGGLVNEQAAAGTVVASLAAVDADPGDTFMFALTDPSGFFDIVGNEIRVAAGATLDFETTPTFVVTVQVTDSTANQFSRPVEINLLDVILLASLDLDVLLQKLPPATVEV